MSLPEGVRADDLHALEVQRTLDGPRPPQNPLVRLIASAQGALTDSVEAFDFANRDRNNRLRTIRLKSRRAR